MLARDTTKESTATLDTSSIRTAKEDEDINWDDISNDRLHELLINAVRMKKILELEIDLFERYLKRHDPEVLQKIDQSGTEAPKSAPRTVIQFTMASPTRSMSGSMMSGRGSPSAWSMQSSIRRGMLDPMLRRLRITIPQRMEMINNEITEVEKKLTTFRHSAEKDRNKLKAEIDEYEIRIREIREMKNRFETEIVVNGVDPLTGKIPAEKVIKFVKDWLKNMNRTIEKIRLKGATTRSMIKRAQRQIKQREELGEELRPVDFQQLRIQNQDYKKKIDDTSVFLLDVKQITARYNSKLSEHKRKMADLMSVYNGIQKEIGLNMKQADHLQSKCRITEKEITKADEQLVSLKMLMEDYEVPPILDFVELQSKLRALQKTYVNFVRRKNVLKIISNS
ncbi:hypothetical protein KPH14_010241 [Odynerus spinipes]|uniref:Cilia- and flagella-associated protein 263 n=1 Tax=Odynerus spinipes TaxID=1348599 RepID=A0AAD9VSS0_9HYME|nr:hypothetical protein KPH14_010241 [Odynerus spinipes]